MKIIWEEFEGKLFIEIYIDPSERDLLEEGQIIQQECVIHDTQICMGIVGTILPSQKYEKEMNDAIEEGQE